MKKNIIIRVAFFLVVASLFKACETDIKKAEDAYSASQVFPIVFSTSGPSLVLKTFTYNYMITYDRSGSTWAWTAVDATVQSVSEDTKTATILFDAIPANDTALVMVTETTAGGVKSAQKVLKVRVNPFCPLAIGGFVGTWSGTDGQGDYTYSSSITTTLSGTNILVSGINVGFMGDFWGENIISGGTCLMTVNNDGTEDIAEQYFCDTNYSVGYKIKGSGIWDNCGAKPKLIINYDIYYPDSNYWIAAHYKSYLNNIDHLTLTITEN